MDIEQFYQWAKVHHYPQLVLGEKDVLKHGYVAYVVLRLDAERLEKARKRVEEGLARLAKIGRNA